MNACAQQTIEELEKIGLESTYVSRPRTLCAVLDEMREAVKTLNFAYISGLIEEAQSLGNRMEASLEANDDWNRVYRRTRKLNAAWEHRKAEHELLVADIEKLKKEKEELLTH